MGTAPSGNVIGLGSERVLYQSPSLQSRASLIALKYSLSLLDPTAGYLGWLAFRDALLRRWLFERGSLSCHYCGKSDLQIEGSRGVIATLDHVIPKARGGPKFDPENLVVSCSPCNAKKADKMPYEFRKK